MINTGKALPAEKTFFLYPCKLEMHLLPVVACNGKNSKLLKEEVFKEMWDYIETVNA